MKKILIIFLSIFLISPVWADATFQKTNSNLEGVFRKNRKGEFVQYDKQGKKIGVYKIINGRLTKVK